MNACPICGRDDAWQFHYLNSEIVSCNFCRQDEIKSQQRSIHELEEMYSALESERNRLNVENQKMRKDLDNLKEYFVKVYGDMDDFPVILKEILLK